jgi:hypothetical protein
LSSIVLIDPATLGYPSSQVPFLPVSPDGLVNLLGDVPVGPNVLTNQDPTNQAQNEPSIAVNPTDPGHVIATSNDYRLRVDPPPEHDVRAGYYVSFDGGNTWPGDGTIDISTIPNTCAAGDPAIAIQDMHNVSYSFIAYNCTTDDSGVTVEKSTDGGSTYVNPFQISDSGLSSNQGSISSIGPEGTLFVAWFNYDISAIRLNKSTYGGQSFGTPVHVASVQAIPSPLPGADLRDNSFPTMDVDPTNGNVYLTWAIFATGTEQPVRRSHPSIIISRPPRMTSAWSPPTSVAPAFIMSR